MLAACSLGPPGTGACASLWVNWHEPPGDTPEPACALFPVGLSIFFWLICSSLTPGRDSPAHSGSWRVKERAGGVCHTGHAV